MVAVQGFLGFHTWLSCSGQTTKTVVRAARRRREEKAQQREPPASQQAGAASALEAPLPPSPNATAAAALHAEAEAGTLAAAMATDADAISEVDESCDVEAGGPPADSADEGEENYIGVIGWELSGGKTSMPCLPALVDPRGPAH